jgi:hypothetical protein
VCDEAADRVACASESVYIICTSMEMQYASQYFMYILDMCLDFFVFSV